MGNSASSQGSSTGTHEGHVGASILEEQHDWPIEQAAAIPDTQSLQEMQNPYNPYAKIRLKHGDANVNQLMEVWKLVIRYKMLCCRTHCCICSVLTN